MKKTFPTLALCAALCTSLQAVESAVGIPRARLPALTLYTTEHADDADRTALATLQGILAREGSREQLFFLDEPQQLWLGMLEKHLGVKTVRGMDAPALIARFAPQAKGYVLYDADRPERFNAASMTAAVNDAVLVERNRLKAYTIPASWREFAPPTAKSEAEVLRALRGGLNTDIVAALSPRMHWLLRDYLAMARAPVLYDLDRPPAWLTEKPKDRLFVGWGNMAQQGGEGAVVSRYSEAGYYTLPTDFMRNLSVLSGYDWPQPLKQKVPPAEPVENPSTHLVSFLLTDGDNLCWVSNAMGTDKRWMGSPARERIPMGYGLPPLLAELGAPIAAWYYENAFTEPHNRDAFVAGPSGMGYFYPSKYPKTLLAEHTAKLARMMGKMDLKYVQILDFRSLERRELWRQYLRHPQIKGLIYIEYAPYHGGQGRIVWAEGKPVVSLRASLWKNLPGASEAEVLEQIKNAPRDLTRAEGYTLIGVHAWSYTMEEVEAFIKTLPKDVTVVAPDVFMETVKRHVRY